MASCIQQHDFKCLEQPCINKAPFSLCKPHLFASAPQLQQTETSPNIGQRIKCQNNTVHVYILFKVSGVNKNSLEKNPSFLKP